MDMKEHKGEIVIYKGKDGEPSLQVRLAAETVWPSQRLMAELFQKDSDTVGLHLKNICCYIEMPVLLSQPEVFSKLWFLCWAGFFAQHKNQSNFSSTVFLVEEK